MLGCEEFRDLPTQTKGEGEGCAPCERGVEESCTLLRLHPMIIWRPKAQEKVSAAALLLLPHSPPQLFKVSTLHEVNDGR